MEFSKNFCRILVDDELSRDEVIEFYDIVTSVVTPTKVKQYRGGTGKTHAIIGFQTDTQNLVQSTAYTGQKKYKLMPYVSKSLWVEIHDRIWDIRTGLPITVLRIK